MEPGSASAFTACGLAGFETINVETLKGYGMEFDGRLLRRGFWLYVWRIRAEGADYYYVGRTGDSSSSHAQSPFNRIGQHLDPRDNAKGNAMLRQLRAVYADPFSCSFKMVAVGPIYPEQDDMPSHQVYRDKVAGLKKAVAGSLRARGLTVLGIHHSKFDPEPGALEEVLAELSMQLGV